MQEEHGDGGRNAEQQRAFRHRHPAFWEPGPDKKAALGTRLHSTRKQFKLDGHRVDWSSRAQRLGRYPKLRIDPKLEKQLEYAVAHPESDVIEWSALVGAGLFQIGAYLAVLQALNSEQHIPPTGYDEEALVALAKQGGDAGGEAQQQLEEAKGDSLDAAPIGTTPLEHAAKAGQRHAQELLGLVRCLEPRRQCSTLLLLLLLPPSLSPRRRHTILQRMRVKRPPSPPGGAAGYAGEPPVEPWTWSIFPSTHSARWSEPGYIAALIQLFGACMFTMSVIVAFNGVLTPISDSYYAAWYVLDFTPQVIGSVCFIVSSYIWMVEVQENWWKPKLTTLGWHAAFWNLIGGIGFLLSAAFAFLDYPVECCQYYGTAVSTYWGAFAFLLGSYLQLVETLNPHRAPHARRLTLRALLNERARVREDSARLEGRGTDDAQHGS
ncbi:hypothetical protein JKP88DRAFT_348718 [Tribonema minus]|uniref:Uncharacterized protein n=1 Tax=Tribonema minus TaxID=303371 RepID=A0A836CEZ2_9STRA|nr:hypothetical protein JKP88DRAFT_348718 [Tribonema minus]